MEVVRTVATKIPISKMMNETIRMAKTVENLLFRKKNRAGVLMIAKNTDIRKGTMIWTAARIPAMTITNAAAVIRNCAGADRDPVGFPEDN